VIATETGQGDRSGTAQCDRSRLAQSDHEPGGRPV